MRLSSTSDSLELSKGCVRMSGEKVLPGGNLASFRSRSNTMPTQNILQRLIRHPMTQVGKGADDAVIARVVKVFMRHVGSI